MIGSYISTYSPAMKFIEKHISPLDFYTKVYPIVLSVDNTENTINTNNLSKDQILIIPKLIELGVIAVNKNNEHVLNPLVAFQYDEMPTDLLTLFPKTPIFESFIEDFFIVE